MPLSDEALALDAADPLAGLRAEFDLEPGVVYLDGNSLGPPPRPVAERMQEVVREQWGGRLIRSWSEGWWSAPGAGRRADRAAGRCRTGAGRGRRLHQREHLQGGGRRPCGSRRAAPEILVDADTFPTDGYLAASAAGLTGAGCRPRRRSWGRGSASGPRWCCSTTSTTGPARWPTCAADRERVHRAGARVVWDLEPQRGVLPVELDARGGGPGGGLHVQVPQRRAGGAGLPVRGRGSAGAVRPAAAGLGRARGSRSPWPRATARRGRRSGPNAAPPRSWPCSRWTSALGRLGPMDLAEVRAKGLR